MLNSWLFDLDSGRAVQMRLGVGEAKWGESLTIIQPSREKIRGIGASLGGQHVKMEQSGRGTGGRGLGNLSDGESHCSVQSVSRLRGRTANQQPARRAESHQANLQRP